ncbi:MAG: hypothetical protein KGL39_36445 [Patescibacteria group bacterium]|nr:hypothetical protein [Patescibacteria group bacterium]
MSLFAENDHSQVKFEDLVGEGRKYKDAEAAAKAIVEKDRFIEQLKAEKAEVLKDLQARPAVDRSQEILDRMEALARQMNKPATESMDTTPTERVEVKGLTEEDLIRVIEQREARKRAQANMDAVKNELVQKYGDGYGTVLKELQGKLGVDQKFLDNLAAQSPTAFAGLLSQVSPTAAPVFTPPVTSKPDAFKPSNSGPKPRSEYLRLKAENKALYDSPATQNQMYKDSMALGEAFFDVTE